MPRNTDQSNNESPFEPADAIPDDDTTADELADYTDELLTPGEDEDEAAATGDADLPPLKSAVHRLYKGLGGKRQPDQAMAARIRASLISEWRKMYAGRRPAESQPFWHRWQQWLLSFRRGLNRRRRRQLAMALGILILAPVLVGLLIFEYAGNGLLGTVIRQEEPYPAAESLAVTDLPIPLGLTWRVSVTPLGEPGNHNSWASSISDDGRFVVFASLADNLLPGISNDVSDVFLYDRQMDLLTRVSLGVAGQEANSPNLNPAISADGRYVAFASTADNLVAGINNQTSDIFLYDSQTETLERISVGLEGEEANGPSRQPALSADGRYVAFASQATNLVANDHNGVADIFVYDRQTGLTERVSVTSDGQEANGESYNPAISHDGRYVAFHSLASNLVADDTNGVEDVFIHDRLEGVTMRASVSADGREGNGPSHYPSLSGDGRYVAFHSSADNLVEDDANDAADVFVYDRITGEIERVSVNNYGQEANGSSGYARISGDGLTVAFASFATNLAANNYYGQLNVYVHDRRQKTTERVSLGLEGSDGDGASAGPDLSWDGRFVSFDSVATNLIPDDFSNRANVFVRDRRPPSQLTLTPRLGQPGSFLQLQGSHFPFGFPLSFEVNGRPLGEAFVPNEGELTVLLDTSEADPGSYWVTVALYSHRQSVSFELDPDETYYPAQGEADFTFAIPAGVAYTHRQYLPGVMQQP